MKKKAAKKWAEALRSEKYQQGRGMLRNDVLDPGEARYCCLGVRCEMLAQKKKPIVGWRTTAMGKVYQGVSSLYWDKSNTTLPQAVVINDKFNQYNPCFAYEGFDGQLCRAYLAELNDQGVPFYQIADLIERFYDQL